MFYGDLDAFSWKNNAFDLINMSAGIGEAKVLGGDDGFYLIVGAPQGSFKAGASMFGGFKLGAEATLTKFTLGFQGDGWKAYGNLNLGSVGGSVSSVSGESIEGNINYGIGGGLGFSRDHQ